jgi:fructokinase
MSILAYLGWQTFPVARLGNDLAADFLRKDLARFGVHLDLLYREKKGRTPIVIEMIPVGTSATHSHFFSFTCPHCGASLPRHRAILKNSVQLIIDQVPEPSVFYFDRISRAAVEMARRYSVQGTLVVFEPSSTRNGKLFKECVEVAHVVKYSQERIGHMPDPARNGRPFLEIETLGAYGLRFRTATDDNQLSNWEYLETYKVEDLKDEAGSGDWCTAGIIHLLGQEGVRSLKKARRERVLKALSLGQALAALNCMYEGARGSMYCLGHTELKAAVEDIIAGRKLKTTAQRNIPEIVERVLYSICANCQNSYKTADLHRVMTSTGRRRVQRLIDTGKRRP